MTLCEPVGVSCKQAVAITALAAGLMVMLAVDGPVSAQVQRTTIAPHVQGVVGTAAANAVPASSKTWHSVAVGPHTLCGTIAALRGAELSLRLRNGRVASIDASSAIANDAFSAPLFVGKMVSIDGSVLNGKFVAAHIVRLTNLTDMPADR